MAPVDDLEALIRRYVSLGKRSPRGFEVVRCAVCRDYKERGGFKFEAGAVGFHCFNCGLGALYDPSVSRRHLSPAMHGILTAFGVPDAEVKRCLFFSTQTYEPPTPAQRKLLPPTEEVPLPVGSVPITGDGSPWCAVAREYLQLRGLEPSASFFVTDSQPYAGRLIIPHPYRGKVVYWQGRALDDSIQPRYKNPTVEKENVFFNADELERRTDEPLFVTEGALDALSIGPSAVSLVGSALSEYQRRELAKVSPRRRVTVVVDKDVTGHKLGYAALDEGWSVVRLPVNLKDANDALVKLGRLWLVEHLASSAWSGFEGRLAVRLCK